MIRIALVLAWALAATPPAQADSPLLIAKSKRPIDPSCLMVCKRWGEDDCLEWVMLCRGDPGYPGRNVQVLRG